MTEKYFRLDKSTGNPFLTISYPYTKEGSKRFLIDAQLVGGSCMIEANKKVIDALLNGEIQDEP